MCGIALILSGVCVVGSDPYRESSGNSAPDANEAYEPVIPVDELKAVLQRRGPDGVSCRKLFLQLERENSDEKNYDEVHNRACFGDTAEGCINSAVKVASKQASATGMRSVGQLNILGATLQLRGRSPVLQPLEDISGNLLVYNGEIFGGINVADDNNDAETLLHALEKCHSRDCCGIGKTCSCSYNGEKPVSEILSTIKGPWSLIYWQEKSKTLWFGRDAFGRRSLLVHWPTFNNSKFVLSSVSPPSSIRKDFDSPLTNDFKHQADSGVADTESTCHWEELPCGIYSIHLKASDANEQYLENWLAGEVKKHEWTDPLLNKIIRWERNFVNPEVDEFSSHGVYPQNGKFVLLSSSSMGMTCDACDLGDHMMEQTKLRSNTPGSLTNYLPGLSQAAGCVQPAHKVLIALRESVRRRSIYSASLQTAPHRGIEMEPAPIALLFSGGLDSMILAALLDQCLDPNCPIDLLNVSFDGYLAPDRISAKAGVQELHKIATLRRWRLVEIDANLSDLTWEIKHLISLIHPAKTYMDLNIGLALWLAAGGDGWVDEDIYNPQDVCSRHKYRSAAKILLVGSGADEQCAGYGRHRTSYRLGGWVALEEELRLDMQRIWKRNLGRDDRCISDRGKEARFPFLDEDVIKNLLEIPLREIADLNEPVGRGDKKILREVAVLLGLQGAAILPKRAIQFGSRIARESNRKNFGSNRAANQASAGSVEIS